VATSNTVILIDHAGAGTGKMKLSLNAAGNFNVVNSGATLNVSLVVDGANGCTMTGAGTIILDRANTFTGTVILSAGTLGLSSNSALNGNALTINDGSLTSSGSPRNLASPAIAGRMFSRWCQENYFGYMMEHYDIDGLIQYGSEEMDGTIRLVNPAWRDLDKQVTRLTTQLRRHQAKLGAAAPPDPDNPKAIEHRATLHGTIQALQIAASQPGARRIQVDVVGHDLQIIGIAVRGVDRDRLVTSLENVSAPEASAVPALAEGSEQEFHPRDQICFRSLQEHVEMVAHHDPSMHPPTMAFADPFHYDPIYMPPH